MEKDKQFGKRDMFYNIQRQMLAIDDNSDIEDKYLAFKEIMVEIEKMLKIEEQLHGISIDYEIDSDIINDSKRISFIWSAELKNKKLPFYATVKGDYLECYGWKDGDKLKIIDCKQALDAEHNEYLWLAENLDRNAQGGVSNYQINIL